MRKPEAVTIKPKASYNTDLYDAIMDVGDRDQTIIVKAGNIQDLLRDLQRTTRERVVSAVTENLSSTFLDTKDIAEKLKVTPATIINWANKGILHPVRTGHKYRFRANELTKFLCK